MKWRRQAPPLQVKKPRPIGMAEAKLATSTFVESNHRLLNAIPVEFEVVETLGLTAAAHRGIDCPDPSSAIFDNRANHHARFRRISSRSSKPGGN